MSQGEELAKLQLESLFLEQQITLKKYHNVISHLLKELQQASSHATLLSIMQQSLTLQEDIAKRYKTLYDHQTSTLSTLSHAVLSTLSTPPSVPSPHPDPSFSSLFVFDSWVNSFLANLSPSSSFPQTVSFLLHFLSGLCSLFRVCETKEKDEIELLILNTVHLINNVIYLSSSNKYDSSLIELIKDRRWKVVKSKVSQAKSNSRSKCGDVTSNFYCHIMNFLDELSKHSFEELFKFSIKMIPFTKIFELLTSSRILVLPNFQLQNELDLEQFYSFADNYLSECLQNSLTNIKKDNSDEVKALEETNLLLNVENKALKVKINEGNSTVRSTVRSTVEPTVNSTVVPILEDSPTVVPANTRALFSNNELRIKAIQMSKIRPL
ncbi:hypothetical protein P9112_014252 [Eukaryota sp. TZLM1-RC]